MAVRERDLAGPQGKFLVEGKVTLETLAVRSRFEIDSVFCSDRRLPAIADTLEGLSADIPVYVAEQGVMDRVVGFPIHRGVLACARRSVSLSPIDLLTSADGPLLVLVGLSNHDNVGAVFRNAAAFGAAGVWLDSTSCDPLYRKAIRVSAGAALWLPFAHGGSGPDLVHHLKAHGYTAWSLTPRADAASLYRMTRPQKLALILGAEGPGLPAEMLDAATPVRIPMVPGVDSINVATAGAIALSALFGR